MRQYSVPLRTSRHHTKFAEILDIWLQYILVELLTVFNRKQNRVQLANSSEVVGC